MKTVTHLLLDAYYTGPHAVFIWFVVVPFDWIPHSEIFTHEDGGCVSVPTCRPRAQEVRRLCSGRSVTYSRNRREVRVAGHEQPGGQRYETGAAVVSWGQVL